MKRLVTVTSLFVIAGLLAAPSVPASAGSVGINEPATSGPPVSEAPQMAAGIIVKRAESATKAQTRASVAEAVGQPVSAATPVTADIAAYSTVELLDEQDAQAAAAAAAEEPGVEWAEPNWLAAPTADMPTPINDEYADKMLSIWDAREANDPKVAAIGPTPWPAGGYSSKAAAAWPATTGAGAVVAVLDTGTLPHPDLAGQYLPGYDMISANSNGTFFMANDGNGRDPDPTDPGDWATEAQCYPGYQSKPTSTWHGTAVSGLIAAGVNNGIGVAGVAPNAKIVPVRVLGRCGGTEADIAAGLVWATGGAVPGVPANPNPAKIVNMSLSGRTSCSTIYSSAIANARSRGALVIVAAGNENSSVGSPANCPGAMAVAATSPYGDRASYSNYGPQVAISAMGGEMSEGDPNTGSLVLGNDGVASATTMNYGYGTGTSYAAPVVAGGAALITSLKGVLPPDTLRAELQAAVVPFPAATSGWRGFATCSTSICGTGILDMSKIVPTVTAAPVISGSARPGSVVTATTGSWAGPATTPSVTWMIDGTPVAEGLSYQVPGDYIGRSLTAFAHGSDAFVNIGAHSEPVVVKRALSSLRTKFKTRNRPGPGKRVRFVTRILVPTLAGHRPSGRLKAKLITKKRKRVVAKGTIRVRAKQNGRVKYHVNRVRKGKYKLKLIYTGDKLVARTARTVKVRVR